MPGLNGTGPQGRGPMTGGGFGYCTGYVNEGENPARPFRVMRGFRGRRAPGTGGRGRGRMNLFYATGQPGWARPSQSQQSINQPTREEEVRSLEQEASELERELKNIRQRMEELKKS